jgi:hypothetical protein
LRRLRSLDKIFLLVVHFDEQRVATTVGRNELE